MRGELFEENEIVDFVEEDIDEYPEHEEKLNPLLSSDIIELQKQHVILLDYVKELEKRNIKLKEKIERLERIVNYYEREEE